MRTRSVKLTTLAVLAVALTAACGSSKDFSPAKAVQPGVPTMWLYTDDSSVGLMTWKITDQSASGTDFDATISAVYVDTGGLASATPDEWKSVSGHLSGEDVALTSNGETMEGTIVGNKLVLKSAGSDDAGDARDETFTATTKSQYEAAVKTLQSHAGDVRSRALDSAMKSDLRTVATDLETAAVDEVPYALEQQGGTITVGEGITADLEDGDSVTLKVTEDGQYFCLVMSNQASPNHWVYTSDDSQTSSGASCPAKFSVAGPSPTPQP